MPARLLFPIVLSAALAATPARAALISTDAALPQDARAQLNALLERPELARELEKYGIAPHEAQARVAAMSDAEVRELSQRVHVLPAGGQITLILLIIILLLIIF